MLKWLWGSRQDRLLKKMAPLVNQINRLEPLIEPLSDEMLAARTSYFKEQLAKGQSLDDLLPEAFAVVREVSRRVLGMRHFDVQLLGGIALHQKHIAEMRTGEGKTLVATLPAYLNALTGKGVHVVTVNDYLARRDAQTMGKVFGFLGLTTGVIYSRQEKQEKSEAYLCDITYGTNSEFGFDYLRDNMATSVEDRVQRGQFYAIVDEVDSILIDEARTPLIISGPAQQNIDVYDAINSLALELKKIQHEDGEGDFEVEEKNKAIYLSETGVEKAEALMQKANLLSGDLYDAKHISLLYHLNAALRAHHLFFKDTQYIVEQGKIVIVDEFTGRPMPTRRWGEGLHQAIEAKEGLAVLPEDQTLATITLQNYFRLYDKLCGMTGTAETDAFELHSIYNLEVLIIPTHRPMIRKDLEDRLFLTQQGKLDHVVKEIELIHQKGQPVLVGTTSIEVSEKISQQLTALSLPHEVLNAKQHEREAHVIAQAGKPGAITIATNMAGRGTDIVLGGHMEDDDGEVKQMWQQAHNEAVAAGGLYVIGTERHESRRIDNQLRGRSGRQGDPGTSRFFLSMEDHLLRVFLPKWAQQTLRQTGMKEDQALESALVNKQVLNAQKKIESLYFDQRKSLLDFDEVANEQRFHFYNQRNEWLESPSVEPIFEMQVQDYASELVNRHFDLHTFILDAQALEKEAVENGITIQADELLSYLPNATEKDVDAADVSQKLIDALARQINSVIQAKIASLPKKWETSAPRAALLLALDQSWQDHLEAMGLLRKGIHLRSMAQKQPKQEYKREAFQLFSHLLSPVPAASLKHLLRFNPPDETPIEPEENKNV